MKQDSTIRLQGLQHLLNEDFPSAFSCFLYLTESSNETLDYEILGVICAALGGFERSLEQAEIVLARRTQCWSAKLRVALLKSSAPNDKIRDGELAVQLSISALGLLGENANWQTLTVHAAALAERGDFCDAVRIIDSAAAMNPIESEIKRLLADRRQLYVKRKPFRLSVEYVRWTLRQRFYLCDKCQKKTCWTIRKSNSSWCFECLKNHSDGNTN